MQTQIALFAVIILAGVTVIVVSTGSLGLLISSFKGALTPLPGNISIDSVENFPKKEARFVLPTETNLSPKDYLNKYIGDSLDVSGTPVSVDHNTYPKVTTDGLLYEVWFLEYWNAWDYNKHGRPINGCDRAIFVTARSLEADNCKFWLVRRIPASWLRVPNYLGAPSMGYEFYLKCSDDGRMCLEQFWTHYDYAGCFLRKELGNRWLLPKPVETLPLDV